jgi:hypothetical protein
MLKSRILLIIAVAQYSDQTAGWYEPGSSEIFFCLSRLRNRQWGTPTLGNVGSSPVENAAEASSWLPTAN